MAKAKDKEEAGAIPEAQQSISVPQLNTLPRNFVAAPDYGTNYRYHPEDFEPGGFLGGTLEVDEGALAQAERAAELNAKGAPDWESIDASFPGSRPALVFQPNTLEQPDQSKIVATIDGDTEQMQTLAALGDDF